MDQQQDVLKPLAIIAVSVSVVGFVCGLIFPEWKALMQGIAVGILTSLISQLHLAFRVHQMAESTVKNVFAHGTRLEQARARSLGFLTRASLMLLVAATAIRFPQHLNVLGAVVGFIFVPLVVLVIALRHRK